MTMRRRNIPLALLATCLSCKVGALVGSAPVTLGNATHLVFVTQPANATAGAPLRVQVSAVDSSGAVVAVFDGRVTLALAANPGGDDLHGSISVTAVQGTATFTDIRIDRAASGYTIGAQTSGLTGATSGSFDIAAGAPASATYTSQPSSTTTGTDITPAVGVQVVDAFGNAVTQYSGTVTITLAHDGSALKDASLQGTTTVTATGGTASFTDLHINQSGLGYTLGVGIPAGAASTVSQPLRRRAAVTVRPAFESGTILVVEDHQEIRRLVDRTLSSTGYTVLAASGATEAVNLVQAHPGAIDLLISEVLLWGMTGAELYGRVRQKHRQLRVLFMSGYSEEVLRQHGVSPATAPFLSKPFGPPVLVGKVREVLQARAPSCRAASRQPAIRSKSALDTLQLSRFAEGLEDGSRLFKVGPGFFGRPQQGTEGAVFAVHPSLHGRHPLRDPAQLDGLLEEHESGLVLLAAPQAPHEGVDLHQAARQSVPDGGLLRPAQFLLGLMEPVPLEMELGQPDQDRALDSGGGRAPGPGQSLPVAERGRVGVPLLALDVSLRPPARGPALRHPRCSRRSDGLRANARAPPPRFHRAARRSPAGDAGARCASDPAPTGPR